MEPGWNSTEVCSTDMDGWVNWIACRVWDGGRMTSPMPAPKLMRVFLYAILFAPMRLALIFWVQASTAMSDCLARSPRSDTRSSFHNRTGAVAAYGWWNGGGLRPPL